MHNAIPYPIFHLCLFLPKRLYIYLRALRPYLARKLLLKGWEQSMKIAIPEFQGRVAPVFDTCRRMLVFAQANGEEMPIADQDWSTVSRPDRVYRLKELQIDILLCGAISCGMEDQIHRRGIRLITWLAGEVPIILTAYGAGTVMEPEYAMPGTLGCRKRRKRRRETAHHTSADRSKSIWYGLDWR